MKTRIIITNGETKIELKPENNFEETALENMENLSIAAFIDYDGGMSGNDNKKIIIRVKHKGD